ncbi:hypothetical protein DO72_5592 [Burkholderia pseudomallei]|nr:hypothetical protein DO72_5592 [Burkholderia pseudomallei]
MLQTAEQSIDVVRAVIALNRHSDARPAAETVDRDVDPAFVAQAGKQRDVVRLRRQLRADHLAVPLVRARRMVERLARQRGHFALRVARKRDAALAHAVPVVLALKRDRARHAQERGDVAAALPLVILDELRRPRVLRLPAPTDDERLDKRLHVRPRIQERAALRRAHPFMQDADIEIRIHLAQRQRQLPGHVRAVDDRQDAARPRARADRRNRKHERGGRRQLADQDRARARRHVAPEILDEPGMRRHRQRHLVPDDLEPALLRGEAPQPLDAAVLVIGGEQFVARAEREAARDDVHARGAVAHIY